MDKKELRIGNIVFTKDVFGANLFCTILTAFQIERFHESYEPIKMDKHLINGCKLENDSINKFEFNDNCELEIVGNSYDANGLFIGKVDLHRFQNIFYDLTNEELIIKL